MLNKKGSSFKINKIKLEQIFMINFRIIRKINLKIIINKANKM